MHDRVIQLVSVFLPILGGVVVFVLALGSLRSIGLGILVSSNESFSNVGQPMHFLPSVRVIVPAFNEAVVITRTLDSLLASDYPNLAVTVIDDGSSDDTNKLVSTYCLTQNRCRLLSQPRSGKAAALNQGLNCSEDIVIIVDADTTLSKTAITALVGHFMKPQVDAVCGNVQVGNIRSPITVFQKIEYLISQNYERKAFSRINCISVIDCSGLFLAKAASFLMP